MLVLSRRVGESLVIGDNVVVTVLEVRGDMIRIGIDAPREVKVHRSEVFQAIEEANKAAASPAAQAISAFTSALAAKKPGAGAPEPTKPATTRPGAVPPGRKTPPPPTLPAKE